MIDYITFYSNASANFLLHNSEEQKIDFAIASIREGTSRILKFQHLGWEMID